MISRYFLELYFKTIFQSKTIPTITFNFPFTFQTFHITVNIPFDRFNCYLDYCHLYHISNFSLTLLLIDFFICWIHIIYSLYSLSPSSHWTWAIMWSVTVLYYQVFQELLAAERQKIRSYWTIWIVLDYYLHYIIWKRKLFEIKYDFK